MNTRSLSPLRYPGGKSGLFSLFKHLIYINQLVGCSYYEPFAGGAGCALRLLEANIVGRIILNDADPCIYSFWKSILNETEKFINRVQIIPLTIPEWSKQKNILRNYNFYSQFDVGFATFYINRCSRSGILSKSGPIGGYEQKNNWKIDARFNRETLVSRINKISYIKDKIEIYNLEALQFMKSKFSKGNIHKKFAYLDPPYISAGERLYLNNYSDKEHLNLSKYMQNHNNLKWIITYDYNEFVKTLYLGSQRYKLTLTHSLQTKQKAAEYVFAARNVNIPTIYNFNSKCIELENDLLS